MEMINPEMPKSKLPELFSDESRDFSTEEIIQVASQLCDGESIFYTTPITPIIKLMVNLDNGVNTKDIINVSLRVLNRDQMRHNLDFPLHYGTIQRAHFIGRSLVDPARLSMKDVVNTFRLDDSTKWHLWGYNITTGDSVRGVRLRE